MSFWASVKQLYGGSNKGIQTLASAATVVVPDDGTLFYISGTTAITSLLANTNITTTGPAFTNTDGTTTVGQMDLGGSDRTIAPTDVLVLMLMPNGSWLMKAITDN